MDQKELTTAIWTLFKEYDIEDATELSQTLAHAILPNAQAAQAQAEADTTAALTKTIDGPAVEAWLKGQLGLFSDQCIAAGVTNAQTLTAELKAQAGKVKLEWRMGLEYDAGSAAKGVEFNAVYAEACRRQQFNLTQTRLGAF